MEMENDKDKFDPVKLFREIIKDNPPLDEIPRYRAESEPFWGDGTDNDIFKAHPEAIKAIPYKPKKFDNK